MSVSGSLATMQLGDLLQWCGANLKTGTLLLKRGPVEKQLFFKDGRLFSSVSSSPRETLGQFLIRSGHITEEDLFKALIEQDRSNQPLGRILVASELLTRGARRHPPDQDGESIYDCFSGRTATSPSRREGCRNRFRLAPARFDGRDPRGRAGPTSGSASTWSFPHGSRRSTSSTEAVEAAKEITEEDRRVLELVARGKNLAEISLELHAVEFYAASRLLELHERKLVRVGEAPERSIRRPGQTLRESSRTEWGSITPAVRDGPGPLKKRSPRSPEQVRAALRDQDQRILEDLQNVADIPSTGFLGSRSLWWSSRGWTSILRRASCSRE
jgi:hypothetical protein